jgi:hypothetical protein
MISRPLAIRSSSPIVAGAVVSFHAKSASFADAVHNQHFAQFGVAGQAPHRLAMRHKTILRRAGHHLIPPRRSQLLFAEAREQLL